MFIRVRVAATAACLLGVITACGSPSAAPGPGRATTEPSVTPSSRLNYARDAQANLDASDAAEKFEPGIEHDSTFGGLAIISSGLRVDVVEQPSPAMDAAISGMRGMVPVQIRHVRHSMEDLQKLSTRILHDQKAWKRKGIVLSGWGPHEDDNTVQVTLAKYRPAAAAQLIDAYRKDLISVSTESVTFSGS